MVNQIKLVVSEIVHKLNYLKPSESSSSLEDKIMNGLQQDGYYVLESFLSSDKCKELRDKSDDFINSNPDKISVESNGSDTRVYGVDKHDGTFKISKIEEISRIIFKKFSFIFSEDSFFLLGRIESSETNLGSGSGWHRDSPISHQFKTILYLSSVNEDNGPFEYIKGSHRFGSIVKSSKLLDKKISDKRFTEGEIAKLVDSEVIDNPTKFTAKEGSLIFVDTRGLHRGAPLREDRRYALTRYHFSSKQNKFSAGLKKQG